MFRSWLRSGHRSLSGHLTAIDARRVRNALVGAIAIHALVIVGSASADAGARRTPGHFPRPVFFDLRQVASQTPAPTVARFDGLVVTETADTTWLEQVRTINPDIRMLLFVPGTTVRDTIKDGWDPSDTSTVQRLRKVHVIRNDWLLKDVNGRPITTWTGPGFDNWAVNLTADCPVNADGERFSVWAARAMARRLGSPGAGAAAYSRWSGLMLDEMWNGASWLQSVFGNGLIDADGDGVPDPSVALNPAWRAETGVYLSELRRALPEGTMLCLNGDTVILEDTDGQAFEDCLAGRPWLEDMYGYDGNHGGYLKNLALSRSGPDQFCLFYARYYEGVTTLHPDRFARLAAGSSCLGDGYYVLERFDAGTYSPFISSPVYDLDLGQPIGEMERSIVNGDTLYSRAFSNAYVQVNPNPFVRKGVPGRDAAFTLYAPPESLSVIPGSFQARIRILVPDFSARPDDGNPFAGNPQALGAIEIRIAPFPIDESTWAQASEIQDESLHGPWSPGHAIEVAVPNLEPGTDYHVAARSMYGSRYASSITPSLTFQTEPDPDGWVPPPGAGADFDLFWWDGFAGSAPDGNVRALAELDGDLYVAGDFSSAGAVAADHIARWDGRAWHPLGSGINGPVHALTVYAGMVAAAGAFTEAGGSTAMSVALWNGRQWLPAGSGLNGTVFALAVHDGYLIAGGEFGAPDGASPRTHALARWLGSNWELLRAGGLQESATDPQHAVTSHGDRLIGQARVIEAGRPSEAIAVWTEAGWDAIGTELSGVVWSLVVHDGDLVAGGRFRSIDGVAANGIVRWDGTRWRNLGAGVDGEIRALASVEGGLVAGGRFTSMPGTATASPDVRNLARFDGRFWSPIGSGVDRDVLAIGTHHGRIVIGGAFRTAGVTPSPFIARWDQGAFTPNQPDPGPIGGPVVPAVVALAPSSPNPFGSSVLLRYALPVEARVRLTLHDVSGRRVSLLVDDSRPAGVHRILWDGRDESGSIVSPGVYFLRLEAGDRTLVRKVVRAR